MARLSRIQPSRQLIPLDIVAPGNKGLNTTLQGQLMDPSYATVALNAVIDTSGRLAARQGMTNQTTTPLTNVAITNEVVGTGNGALVTFTGTLLHANDVASSITFTAGAVVGTDNGVGGITGAGIVTGTINYVTGNWAITYSAAVGNGTNITCNYTYTPIIQTIFEYNLGAGSFQNIVAWNGGMSTSITNPNTSSIAGGTATTTNGIWQFGNFNGKAIGFQNGQVPCVYTGSGNLNTVVGSPNAWPVSSGVGATVFGRVWSVSQSDQQTITYSGLLNETAVGTADSGVINMANIWSAGTDQVTAIFAFNASLVVCGLNHIIFFTDGRGSLIGLDPTQAYVFDMLVGTGCTSQRTVQSMGEGDIILLTPNGVQSLARLTTDRNNPNYDLTKYVRDVLLNQINKEVSVSAITATYNPLYGFYLLCLPTAGVIYCLDQRRRYQDDVGNVCSIVTTWAMEGAACATTHSYFTYVARTAGKVALYTGLNDEGTPYTFQWQSPWISFAQQGGPQISTKLKMLKRYELIVFTGGNATLTLQWNTDFTSTATQATVSLVNIGTNSQYGVGQYGIAQYGGGAGTTIVKYDSRARGQYYQLGCNIAVGSAFALQQAQVATKLGRVA